MVEAIEAIEAVEAVEAPHPVFKQFATESHSLELVNAMWCPLVINWFINPIKYSYICHKP